MYGRSPEQEQAGAVSGEMSSEGHLCMAEYKDSYEEFERASNQKPPQVYRLRLYVTGASRSSLQAVANLKAFCHLYLAGRYELEVIDLYQQPELAAQEHLLVAPTLVKTSPPPMRKLIGTLSNAHEIARVLDVYAA
jgi:circadian clock protein KaiB